MSDCPSLPKCIFFNDKMASRPATAELMKTQYCKGEFATCARYQVSVKKGSPAVPADLYPNQHERLAALLNTP